MKKTLIVRYLRLGDAIIVLPLIYDLAIKYPKDKFTVLSNSKLECLFKIMPQNVEFMPMVSKDRKSFFRGLKFAIQKQIMTVKLACTHFDNIAFLQGESFDRRLIKRLENNNTNIVKSKKPEFDSKQRLSIRCNDDLTILKLHQENLKKLGYVNIIANFDASAIKKIDLSFLFEKLNIDNNKKILAIAPFSAQCAKIYPLDKMEQVIHYFSSKTDKYEVLILGGGDKEKSIVTDWSRKYPRIKNLIDKLSFEEEVLIVAHCNLVLTMDSANLHLASLLNTPVISIWGTTTPKCGYYPSKEPLDRAIMKNLDCQPCSLWGDAVCHTIPQYKCMDIDPEIVIKNIESVIYNSN